MAGRERVRNRALALTLFRGEVKQDLRGHGFRLTSRLMRDVRSIPSRSRGDFVSRILVFCLLLCLGCPLGGLAAENRVALVIGNGSYPDSPLKNPPNDARAMAEVLRKLDFDVIEIIDAGQKEMRRAIYDFGDKLKKDGVGFFYYAGHGLQVRNENWLIPVDARISSESDIEAESLSASRVLGKMEDMQTAVNIVILDACRNNPFARGWRGMGRGLAMMDAPRGSLIVYATGPGQEASDGDGSNGVFTQYLIQELPLPGQSLQQTILNVRVQVMDATGNQQIPWDASSMTKMFFPAGEAPGQAVEGGPDTGVDARTSAKPIPVGSMVMGQKMWAEPRAMYGDRDRKLFLRQDSMASPAQSATATMLLEKTATGYRVDVSRCDYKWDAIERHEAHDLEVIDVKYFHGLRDAVVGEKLWASPDALYADKNRTLYLKSDTKLYSVKKDDSRCLSVELTEKGFVADVRGCRKKFSVNAQPAEGDVRIADVVFGN